MTLSLKEQVEKAIRTVDDLFTDAPLPPKDATIQSLWNEILALKNMIRKPKVELACKLLLEDPTLAALPIPLIANIVKACYHKRGFKCNCKEASVRWYISQRTMEWAIVQRQDPKTLI